MQANKPSRILTPNVKIFFILSMPQNFYLKITAQPTMSNFFLGCCPVKLKSISELKTYELNVKLIVKNGVIM